MTTRLSGKKTVLIATAAIAALVLGVSGVFAQNAGQAFAQVQNQTATQDNNGQIVKAIVKDIRDHRGEWTGLSTVSHSLVPGVKILGVTEKSSNTVEITLAHMANGTIDVEIGARPRVETLVRIIRINKLVGFRLRESPRENANVFQGAQLAVADAAVVMRFV